jgi:lycopene beta-cyclase
MDARLPQDDGYRFMYVLPFGPTRLLIEDTRFADDARLDVAATRTAVMSYAAAQGWTVAEVVREETGVLPMPWQAPVPEPADAPLTAGMQGGWFHPATGYSLPVAARLAQWLTTVTPEEATGIALGRLRADHAERCAFAHRMNWALFRLADPQARVAMMRRFYRRPESVIRRFYALDLQWLDQFRIVAGPPPEGMRWLPRPMSMEVMP